MARDIKTIQQTMLDAIAQTPDLSALQVLTDQEQGITGADSTSRVARWRLQMWCHAYGIYVHELEWDVFMQEVEARVAKTRVHTKKWYQERMLAFQLGAQTDANGNYDNSNRTPEEVDAMKVIKYAAVTKLVTDGVVMLRIKVAGETNGELTELSQAAFDAADDYREEFTDAGTFSELTMGPGDDLKLELEIHFDPQILDAEGKRLDGTNDTPVQDSIKAFLKDIQFNGEYVKAYHTDALQQVEGVEIPVIRLAASKYGTNQYDSTSLANAGEIDQLRVADSGYFKWDEAASTINFIPRHE